MRPVWEYSDHYCHICCATKESDPTSFKMGWSEDEGHVCDYCAADLARKAIEAGEFKLTAKISINDVYKRI